MFELYGLVLYEILDGGNLLSGIYTNNGRALLNVDSDFDIESEVARRGDRSIQGIGGTYTARYIIERGEDGGNNVFNSILVVRPANGVFQFTWQTEDAERRTEYEGIGMMVGQSHVAVSYIERRNQS